MASLMTQDKKQKVATRLLCDNYLHKILLDQWPPRFWNRSVVIELQTFCFAFLQKVATALLRDKLQDFAGPAPHVLPESLDRLVVFVLRRFCHT